MVIRPDTSIHFIHPHLGVCVCVCVCEDELVLLALWGHKYVEHIVGTRLPSGDKTQVILMQIVRGVKEIFLK